MTDDLDRRLNPFRYDSTGRLTPAARRQDSRLRPPPVPGRPAGNAAPLRVEPSVLRARARECEAVAERFGAECLAPLHSTGGAGEGMRGFRSAGGLSVLEQRWRAQVRHTGTGLLGTFARDLLDGARALAATDAVAAQAFG